MTKAFGSVTSPPAIPKFSSKIPPPPVNEKANLPAVPARPGLSRPTPPVPTRPDTFTGNNKTQSNENLSSIQNSSSISGYTSISKRTQPGIPSKPAPAPPRRPSAKELFAYQPETSYSTSTNMEKEGRWTFRTDLPVPRKLTTGQAVGQIRRASNNDISLGRTSAAVPNDNKPNVRKAPPPPPPSRAGAGANSR